MRGPALALALALAVGVAHAESPGVAAPCAPDRVQVETPQGWAEFTVELAVTPAEQAQGLMFRPSLAPDRGMLFVFDPPRPAAFWMRNTMIPLDMVFVTDAGRVESLAARTQPYSEAMIPSQGPVRAVLEIAGGRAAELGIAPGAGVRHPAFAAAEPPLACAP